MATQPTDEQRAYYELAYEGWIPFAAHPVDRFDGIIRTWIFAERDVIGRTVFGIHVGDHPAHPSIFAVVAYRPATMKHYHTWGMGAFHDVHEGAFHDIAARILADQMTMAGKVKR